MIEGDGMVQTDASVMVEMLLKAANAIMGLQLDLMGIEVSILGIHMWFALLYMTVTLVKGWLGYD